MPGLESYRRLVHRFYKHFDREPAGSRSSSSSEGPLLLLAFTPPRVLVGRFQGGYSLFPLHVLVLTQTALRYGYWIRGWEKLLKEE